MIAQLRGDLIEKDPARVILDCQGVGYELLISLQTHASLPDEGSCKLFTHMLVREDAQLLYGFSTREERSMFRHLIDVSGVGASTAIVTLSALSSEELRRVIVEGDVATLKGIKGIGPRSAQRIIVDLKDKLEKETFIAEESKASGNSSREEALSALAALGIDQSKARQKLDKIIEKEGADTPVEQLVKTTLKAL